MNGRHAGKPTRTWRLSILALVVALFCLGGISIALYPSTAQWFSATAQADQVRQGIDDVKVIGPASRLKALQQAAAYNAALDAGAAVKANERVPVDSGATLPGGYNYSQLLAANRDGLMGRIVIPSIDADLPIYHGTSDATLAEGIGHLEGSSLPVGGTGTHAVLAGHRGLASSTLFTHLDQVHNGDTFTIYVFGETLTYKVSSIKIVDPDQTKTLNPVQGRDLVTLVTCTPIGINSQRILVTGERVTPTPATAVSGATQEARGPGVPWWAVGFAAVLSAAAVFLWWSGLPPRTKPTRSGSTRRSTRSPAPEPTTPSDRALHV
ncbi:class C sortase [Leifsonia naganoensis]|uniref:Sortase A n=1 Tax=Leifsonia naganoensis TaxID=150025 RepID=A0A853DMG6_9MICO|nr:class C sortase [Leifsonia naganoensis]NYK09477.1 sortase A [Leifsonia naganoensis]